MKKLTLIVITCLHICLYARDQVAIVLILDGCSMDTLQKTIPYCTGGFKEFFNHGRVYTQARYPYGALSTGPGHTTINTGALPRDSKIPDNSWFDESGIKVACDNGDPSTAAVFAPHGVYEYGKSPEHICADGVSDQLMLAQLRSSSHEVYALSHKSRAAICCAGKLGKALWLDGMRLTSSKFYFDQLPTWIEQANKEIKQPNKEWHFNFDKKHPAYAMTYPFHFSSQSIAESAKQIPLKKLKEHTTPASIELLLQWAYYCLQNILKNNPQKTLLYISISATDMVGHFYGPDSIEYIDLLYHVDKLLAAFLQQVKMITTHHETVFILTADHGHLPLTEVMQEKGFSLAQRINTRTLRDRLNDEISTKFALKNVIKKIDTPWVYLHPHALIDAKRKTIIEWIVARLKKVPGISQVWDEQTLLTLPSQPHDWISRFKNQLVPGRSAPIIFQTNPYTYVTKYPNGTGHNSPYEYSTHVPLIWYQKEVIATNIIIPVWLTQLAPSLAEFFHIQRPSAALYESLPTIAT